MNGTAAILANYFNYNIFTIYLQHKYIHTNVHYYSRFHFNPIKSLHLYCSSDEHVAAIYQCRDLPDPL
jgi:hypothetical protein